MESESRKLCIFFLSLSQHIITYHSTLLNSSEQYLVSEVSGCQRSEVGGWIGGRIGGRCSRVKSYLIFGKLILSGIEMYALLPLTPPAFVIGSTLLLYSKGR